MDISMLHAVCVSMFAYIYIYYIVVYTGFNLMYVFIPCMYNNFYFFSQFTSWLRFGGLVCPWECCASVCVFHKSRYLPFPHSLTYGLTDSLTWTSGCRMSQHRNMLSMSIRPWSPCFGYYLNAACWELCPSASHDWILSLTI